MGDDVARCIIEAIRAGDVTDRDSLQRLKMQLCSKYGPDKVPPNSEVLALVPEEYPTIRPNHIRERNRRPGGRP